MLFALTFVSDGNILTSNMWSSNNSSYYEDSKKIQYIMYIFKESYSQYI